jgi:hypothetical protein
MKFFVTFFATFLVLTISYLAIYQIVDPRGEFQTGKFPQPLANARISKQSSFRTYHSEAPVQGLILGSSRSMPLEPRVAEAVTGHRFFNFSVENAKAEDYLAIYRWVKSQGVQPKHLIIGLDVEALHSDDQLDERLTGSPELHRALLRKTGQPSVLESADTRLNQAGTALTIQSAIAVSKGVALKVRPVRQADVVQADGHTDYPIYKEKKAEGSWDLERMIGAIIPTYVSQFKGMQGLSEERKRRLAELLAEAAQDGAAVDLWIPPLHSKTVDALKDTPYEQRKAEVFAYAQEIAAKYGARVYDFSRAANFGGSDTDFRDGAHMDHVNAEKVLRAIGAGAR